MRGRADVIVTSPPYNLGINYGTYQDDIPRKDYLEWTKEWMSASWNALSDQGSFFLNVGSAPSDPWICLDVAQVARQVGFVLQNRIIWVKSIHVETTTGHFKPINSKRYVNDCHEFVFHFTKTGRVPLDRLAVGVPFADVSNTKRWSHGKTVRCRGNTWYIPYSTVQSRKAKGGHPATFPVELPEMCIKLHGLASTRRVLDPFGGIGTTALAANRLGIDSTSFDIDEGYCKLAVDRLVTNTEFLPISS